MTSRGKRLEAPHRRTAGPPRVVEKVAVRAYRATAWLLARVPQAPARFVIGRGAQLSYLLWPTKRRWSNANFGHVLGLDPGHPEVRRLALAAYLEYGRYLVEIMRLPTLSRDEAGLLVRDSDLAGLAAAWHESEGGLILAAGHVGNNEAVAAGVASHGWPISVLADDSTFPELFDDLRRMRESWGVRIVPWRNLREIFGVLKRREMLALIVDWGYRPDGIPVRLFDAWTTLPAGPATLAAKSRSPILPIVIRRIDEGRFAVEHREPIVVASTEPAELYRATQALADALAETIAAAPHQWYSFKPMWPATAVESEALERRALEVLGDAGEAGAA